MSHSTDGQIIWSSPNSFDAFFTVDGVQRRYSARFRPPVPPHHVEKASISYRDPKPDFIGSTRFEGFLDDKNLNIALENPGGVVMTGELGPGIGTQQQIHGEGRWITD